MRKGNSNILGNLKAPKINQLSDNILLNAFDIAINGSITRYNMVDGIRDAFIDESGIDTGSSINQVYNSANDYYINDSDLAGITTDTKLMLHFNGTNASTTITDDSDSNHTMTAQGDMQLDTSVKKWGSASGLFDGTGDYISSPDSDDWDLCSQTNFTVDFWLKLDVHTGTEYLIGQFQDSNNFWAIRHVHDYGLDFFLYKSGFLVQVPQGGEITDSDWHHVALCKVSDDYGMYLDGTQTNYVNSSGSGTLAGSLIIGRYHVSGDYHLDGHMDELRINFDNYFSASPNVGKTDTITIPTGEYAEVGTSYDMTLISNTVNANSVPENSRIVLFEEDIDTLTLNTDLKAWVSRDGGSTWAQVTLSDVGDYDDEKRILAGSVDLTQSGIGSGTSMKYKVTTHNNKGIKLYGIGELWD